MSSGAILGNLEVCLLQRSLKTLALRMKQHSKSAFKIIDWMKKQNDVVEYIVNGAVDDKALFVKSVQTADVLKNAKGKIALPCFTFCLKEEAFVDILKKELLLFTICTSLGGAASSIDHRVRWDSKRDRREFRMSVGLEDANDLIKDLERAFNEMRKFK